MSDAIEVEVIDAPSESRFEARVGGQLAGAAYYERVPEGLVFTHTEVDDAFEGRGVGSALVRQALDAARARGERIAPLCPFVSAYVGRHREYADLVDLELLRRFGG